MQANELHISNLGKHLFYTWKLAAIGDVDPDFMPVDRATRKAALEATAAFLLGQYKSELSEDEVEELLEFLDIQ